MEENGIIKRRIRQQKLRRKARRGEIAIRRIYKLIRLLFILFIFYLTYRLAFAHYWYLPKNIYDEKPYKHIEILGNSIVPSEKIINKMKEFPLPYKPLYLINPVFMEQSIEELSPVKRAYIRRYWLPARLTVMIEEITPAITIAPAEDTPDVAAFSFDGKLIGREYLPLPSSFQAVKILSYGNKGDDYENWDKDKINNLYTLAKLLEEYSGEQLLYIDLRNNHDVFAKLETVTVRLGEIDSSVQERIKSIRSIIPQIKQISDKIKYIDLSWKESKYIKLDNNQ